MEHSCFSLTKCNENIVLYQMLMLQQQRKLEDAQSVQCHQRFMGVP